MVYCLFVVTIEAFKKIKGKNVKIRSEFASYKNKNSS